MCAAVLVCAAGAGAINPLQTSKLEFGASIGAGDISGVIQNAQDGISLAEDAPPSDAQSTSLADMVARLDSDDLAERERATQRLINNKTYAFTQVETLLRTDTLSAEQRQRLMRVAKAKFAGTSRAAMGVQFDNFMPPTRVVVGKTFEPFASSTMLEEGDMIVEAAGLKTVGLGAWNKLRAVILAHEPGDVLSLTVRRGSEKIKMDLPLGNFGDLQNGRIDPVDIERAWRVYVMLLNRNIRQAAPASKTVIETGMKPVRPLNQAEYTAQQDRMHEERLRRMRENPNWAMEEGDGGDPLRGGGSRVAATDDRQAFGDGRVWFAVNQQGQIINVAGGHNAQEPVVMRLVVGGDGAWGEDPFDPQTTRPELSPAEELANLVQSFEEHQQSLEGLDPRLVDRGDPQMIRDERGRVLKQLRVLERQIKAIQAEIDEQTAVSAATLKSSTSLAGEKVQ